ncbi:hypothetical protein [Ammoniphilus sp. YIM 78166]|uniref:hypothetical protein n=1 Tax=Ammoniphilus sp. YIM 78166 TaxID=1644106 RepID=UPI00106FF27D|nr:hypothetical protein [Ammoniphilus sp. YIM 78166]
MKCKDCGYEHHLNTQKWVYIGDECYVIQANYLDEPKLTEIADHALSLNPEQDAIYIDRGYIDILSCEACFLTNTRNQLLRIEQKYFENNGLSIIYYF